MLGKVRQRTSQDGVFTVDGYIRTYSLNLNFYLEPNDNRQSSNSPTHNIIAKGVHGADFHAGKAWGGLTQDGSKNKFDLIINIPELFNKEQRYTALEKENEKGIFEILPPKQDAVEQPQAAAA